MCESSEDWDSRSLNPSSDSGRIITHDLRVNSSNNPITRAADIIQLATEVTSTKFHPTIEHLFITADAKGNVCLRDTRMAFGPRKSRTNNGIVRSFCTTLAKRNIRNMSNPESSSVAFDREGIIIMFFSLGTLLEFADAFLAGKKIAVTFLVSDPEVPCLLYENDKLCFLALLPHHI